MDTIIQHLLRDAKMENYSNIQRLSIDIAVKLAAKEISDKCLKRLECLGYIEIIDTKNEYLINFDKSLLAECEIQHEYIASIIVNKIEKMLLILMNCLLF